ncbi:regulatory protein RecX [Microbacterium sp. 179-B 1A2 NHS]|uniref:regulatory protein RecX n=1 Tax=Microbacterium sp. 179-B 1A2 NHS TaxID=3142383 RepID=UPI0039A2310D
MAVRFDGGEPEGREDTAGLAPVIPLFGGRGPGAPSSGSASDERAAADVGSAGDAGPGMTWHRTWVADQSTAASEPTTPDDGADRAEKLLLRKLRTRSLSIREARTALRESELHPAVEEALIERFVDRGYLDDEALAEELIHKALSRKAQGRQAVSQTLSQRGLPRDVIEIALAALPDDETERALEFARAKASSMSDLDRDVALRRLSGQLARRGFGSLALSAARQALDEQTKPTSGVRFE